MTKKEFFYPSSDGIHEIRALRWQPEGTPVGVLQIVHGMAEYMNRYEELATFFCEKGFVVTGNDHLGHGPLAAVEERGYFTKEHAAEAVVSDVHTLTERTKAEFPDVPYYVLGHSMGSFVLRNYLALYSDKLAGAIVCGTGWQAPFVLKMGQFLAGMKVFFGGAKRKAGLINVIAFGSYCKRIPGASTGFEWLSSNEASVKKYMADDLCGFVFTGNGFQTMFKLIEGCQKPEAFALSNKQLPILVTAGAEDPVGAYGAAPKEVARRYEQAGMQNVTCVVYDGLRHEIFNEECRQQVYEDFYYFLHGTKQ